MAYNAFMKHIMSASGRQLSGGKERKEEQWEVRITDGLSSWKEGWGEDCATGTPAQGSTGIKE